MLILILIIVLALIFDFINGFHDAANSIATIVSTKVLTPFQAVLWAAFFNFAAFFIFKEHKVAGTIANIISESVINFHVIIAATTAAILWNLFTWYYGIPSSSSHTLIGGLAGAAIAAGGGFSSVNSSPITTALIFMIVSPIIGMILAFIITVITVHVAKRSKPSTAEKWFKNLQLLSSASLSLAHGGGDSQKTMGLILTAIWFYQKQFHSFGGSIADFDLPEWVPIACYSAIAFGTMAGGWKIVKTMGTKITKVTPLEGFCAEGAGAITIFMTVLLGIPVSTTHTITGSIIGVGATKRLSAVRWGVTINLIWAWILTIPVSALVAALVFYILNLLF